MMTKQSPSTRPGQKPQKPQMPPKKVYTREFKLETLRLLRSSVKTRADLERELGGEAGAAAGQSAQPVQPAPAA